MSGPMTEKPDSPAMFANSPGESAMFEPWVENSEAGGDAREYSRPGERHCIYRFHQFDPVYFARDPRIMVQTLG